MYKRQIKACATLNVQRYEGIRHYQHFGILEIFRPPVLYDGVPENTQHFIISERFPTSRNSRFVFLLGTRIYFNCPMGCLIYSKVSSQIIRSKYSDFSTHFQSFPARTELAWMNENHDEIFPYKFVVLRKWLHTANVIVITVNSVSLLCEMSFFLPSNPRMGWHVLRLAQPTVVCLCIMTDNWCTWHVPVTCATYTYLL